MAAAIGSHLSHATRVIAPKDKQELHMTQAPHNSYPSAGQMGNTGGGETLAGHASSNSIGVSHGHAREVC
jgi:hypothetical protein